MNTGDSRLLGVSEVITRASAQRRTGSVNKSLRRMLRMMAVVLTALMTIAACATEDDVIGDDDGGGDGGGGGGVVAGKRLKTMVQADASGTIIIREEFTYNSDGSQKRVDLYNALSTSVGYNILTNNSDGTIKKDELFTLEVNQVWNYTYDSNKKPLKAEGTIDNKIPASIDYTFQNGRQIRQVLKISYPGDNYIEVIYEHNYDSNGRRISTDETHNLVGKRKLTRTYNSDGTLQKVVASDYSLYANTRETFTFTWENGKSTQDIDDLLAY